MSSDVFLSMLRSVLVIFYPEEVCNSVPTNKCKVLVGQRCQKTHASRFSSGEAKFIGPCRQTLALKLCTGVDDSMTLYLVHCNN